MLRQRASQQHVDYLRQLKPSRPYRQVNVDPALSRPWDEVRQVFNHPELTKQPTEDEARQHHQPLKTLEQAMNPTYEGELGKVDVEPFGSLEVVHGDIFKVEDVEAVLLPMAPNLVPYRGLALEAFDRGGKELVIEAFEAAKKDFERSKAGGEERPGLQVGDVVVVDGRGVAAKKIVFVIMPWFWQGSPMDAQKRLRHCVKRAFSRVASIEGFTSIAVPNLSCGVFGYEPRASSRVLLEEAMEAMLQIEAQTPCYNLKRVTFMDSRLETAEELQEALVEVSHRWLPDHRLTTAPQFWGTKTRRLLLLPAVPNFFLKRDPVKFKKFHGIARRWRKKYLGSMRPFLWRPQRVHQPPPLLVYGSSGEAAPQDRQIKGRPYFFRGVTHWLFPSRRSGFHAMRKSSGGQWVAQSQAMRLRDYVRPRM